MLKGNAIKTKIMISNGPNQALNLCLSLKASKEKKLIICIT